MDFLFENARQKGLEGELTLARLLDEPGQFVVEAAEAQLLE